MPNPLDHLLSVIRINNGVHDKPHLTHILVDEFHLVKDRSVYYSPDFAIRFSSSNSHNFSNTVLSLSNLRKFDHLPFIVCLVTPSQNHCFIANSTFLKKISHSSQELRENNIRGSFNGSDIVREFEGILNTEENIARLFAIHLEIGFEGNLARLVESTNNISPSGTKFHVDEKTMVKLLDGPARARRFVDSEDWATLKADLDLKVKKFNKEILLAALIDNVNVRGRVIEYLIAGDDESLRQQLVSSLKGGWGLPPFKTDNTLGDHHMNFGSFHTATDVKTKIMILNSNPKGYNLDKMLEFLGSDKSVFMFYFVGIDPLEIVNTVLVSIFQKDLLRSTILLRHWSGRNSRGVTQFEGKAITGLINTPSSSIDESESVDFLKRVIAL